MLNRRRTTQCSIADGRRNTCSRIGRTVGRAISSAGQLTSAERGGPVEIDKETLTVWEIQTAITDLMMDLVDELKQTDTIDWYQDCFHSDKYEWECVHSSGLAVENCLLEISKGIIERQMKSLSNSIMATDRLDAINIVSDMEKLHRLFLVLLSLDLVEFLHQLEMTKFSRVRSKWMLHDTFKLAKGLVFVLNFKDEGLC